MESSFAGSALDTFIKKVDELTPSFASRPSQIPNDEVVCTAPPMMGKYLAMRDLLRDAEQQIDAEERLKANRACQSLCEHLASMELREAISSHPRRKDMVVRSSGVIVIVKNPAPTLPARSSVNSGTGIDVCA